MAAATGSSQARGGGLLLGEVRLQRPQGELAAAHVGDVLGELLQLFLSRGQAALELLQQSGVSGTYRRVRRSTRCGACDA